MDIVQENSITLLIVLSTFFIIIISLFMVINTIISKRKSDQQELKLKTIEANHQKEVFKSMVTAQEAERKRIADNLHDDISASLTALGLMIDTIRSISTGEINDISKKSWSTIKHISDEMKNVINDLSPTALNINGLISELNKLCNLINNSSELEIEIITNIKNLRFPENVEINIYRIIKEFINNSLKYSKATKIDLEINKIAEELHIEINDNGIGFETEKHKDSGHGIKNMESRAYLLNGSFNFKSVVNKGTKLNIVIPLNNNSL